MTVAILILVCLLVLINIFIYGGLILIRKELPREKTNVLPRVMPAVLRTMAEELDRVAKLGKESEEGLRWTDEFFSEQPSLAHFINLTSQRQDMPSIVPAVTMYKLLKAQLEADSLTILLKERK